MTEQEILRLYCSLMEEVKTRISVVNLAYQNRATLPPDIVREICYLQFRFICEIISLACLAAHGDIKNKEAERAYEPHKIMRELEKLNPHFYPEPVERAREKDSRLVTITRKSCECLSRKELKDLWNKAGAILHRGSMSRLRKGGNSSGEDYSDILNWSRKINALLDSHWISVLQNKRGILVSLVSEETKRAAVTVFDFTGGGGTVVLTTVYVSADGD